MVSSYSNAGRRPTGGWLVGWGGTSPDRPVQGRLYCLKLVPFIRQAERVATTRTYGGRRACTCLRRPIVLRVCALWLRLERACGGWHQWMRSCGGERACMHWCAGVRACCVQLLTCVQASVVLRAFVRTKAVFASQRLRLRALAEILICLRLRRPRARAAACVRACQSKIDRAGLGGPVEMGAWAS